MYILVSVRKLIIVFLSLLLSYVGAAWALEACLRHDDHSDHATLEKSSHSHAFVDHDSSQGPSVPVIHCTSLIQQLGPAARIASAEISRPDKVFAFHTGSFPDAVSAGLRNDLWLEAVFRRIITFSSPIDLARHLFLSVLRI
jgi:hypothetical protein